VDLGAMNRRDLERLVRQQVQEVIFELMNWSEGYFSFEETSGPRTSAEASVRIPTESLLMEAARRIDEWSRIEARVPHLGVVPRFADADSQHGMLDLTPFEWEVIATVDGARDLRVIAEVLGRAEFEIARTIFGLTSTGVVVLDDPTLVATGPEAPDVTQLVVRAEEQLASGDVDSARLIATEATARFPDQAGAHAVLGRVLLAGEHYAEAEEAFFEALRLEPSFASARRLLGTAQAASGRFDEAIASWQRWRQLAERSPEEMKLQEGVDRLQAAARLLSDAIKGWYD